MKTHFYFAITLFGLAALPLLAQDVPAPMPLRSPMELDQLVSPVALYPDPLLGTMLPASTHPSEISAAASLLASNSDPSLVAQQPWDDSVKALAQYSDVVQWMAQNPDWTNQFGAAVLEQQSDVLASVQRLRRNALQSGMLASTPQQQVVVNNDTISIVPAQPDTIYVPTYDSQYLYQPTYSSAPPVLRFGLAYPIALGLGLAFGVDWLGHSVWMDHARDNDRDWRRIAAEPRHQYWRPTETAQRPQFNTSTERVPIARPAPYSNRYSRWTQPTRTPGLVPTGRSYPEQAPQTYAQPWQNRTYAYPTRPQTTPANRDYRTYDQKAQHKEDEDDRRRRDRDHDRDRDRDHDEDENRPSDR